MNGKIEETKKQLFVTILSDIILENYRFVLCALQGEGSLVELGQKYLENELSEKLWDGNPATSSVCGILDAYISYKTSGSYTKGRSYAQYLSERGGVISKYYKNKKYGIPYDNEHDEGVLTLCYAISIIEGNNLFDKWLENEGKK